MPNKNVHDTMCLFVAEHGFWMSFPLGWTGGETIAFMVGAVTGIILSPDLDYAEKREPTLWNRYWHFYGAMMPHRSPLSHMPFVSTIIRLIYFPWWILPVAFLWRYGLFHEWMLEWWLAGLFASDIIHWAVDLVTTFVKRRI